MKVFFFQIQGLFLSTERMKKQFLIYFSNIVHCVYLGMAHTLIQIQYSSSKCSVHAGNQIIPIFSSTGFEFFFWIYNSGRNSYSDTKSGVTLSWLFIKYKCCIHKVVLETYNSFKILNSTIHSFGDNIALFEEINVEREIKFYCEQIIPLLCVYEHCIAYEWTKIKKKFNHHRISNLFT